MYKKHFGLERRIFRGNAAGADVFVGPQTANVLGGIKKALSGPDAVVTLTGPVGCGKSTTAAYSLSAISGKNAIVRIGRFPLQRGELLDLLFDHMRIQHRPQRNNQKLTLFRQLLFNLAQNDSRMFILVEDAPFLGPDLLAELEVATAADTGPSDGAAVILMGDEYLRELLASKPLARLRQRIRLRRTLEPCTVEELGGYLRHCFRQAGGDFDKLFASPAVEQLHELSGGILRVVNNLVESSLEAAADAGADVVGLELVSRIADEEFGLTGQFTRLPQIESTRPEPRHSDDATAELVALSLPEPDPVIAPTTDIAETRRAEEKPADDVPAAVQEEDDIPHLIQDTQPALAILNDAPPPKPRTAPPIHDTLPDIEALSAELGLEPDIAELEQEAAQERVITTPKTSVPRQPATPARVAKPARAEKPATKPEIAAKPAHAEKPATKPESAAKPARAEKPAAAPERVAKPDTSKQPVKPKDAAPPAPPPELKLEAEPEPILELEAEPQPTARAPDSKPAHVAAAAAPPQDEASEEETPAWDRDPTLAELRPDLEALERAMAVAHGRDPNAGEDAPVVAPEVSNKVPKVEIEEIPEITLDDSINRKVDRAALERKQRLEKEGIVEEEKQNEKEKPAEPEVSGEDRAREEKAAAELEKIAEGLARAKTIEDVDDKMAETLFGEELSVAAAAVAKRVAAEAEAAASKGGNGPADAGAKPEPAKTAMEKEFENVWGATPEMEVSIDSSSDESQGGLDISASQRLATVRALNTGKPDTPGQQPAPAAARPAAKPDPIEEQITTSLTQTMKALNVNPAPAAVNDDDEDDDDKRKGGFFSQFRRS